MSNLDNESNWLEEEIETYLEDHSVYDLLQVVSRAVESLEMGCINSRKNDD